MLAYLLAIAYLAVEYIQPGVKSPAIGALRPALVVGGLLGVTTLLEMVARNRPVVLPRQSRLFLVLLALMAVSMLTAVVKQSAWLVLTQMLKMFAIYFALTQVVDSPSRLRGLLYAFVGINFWVAVEGLRGFYAVEGREGATTLTGVLSKFLGNNNDFALAMVLVIPFAFFLMVHNKSWLARGALLGCLIAFAAGIITTLSRGGQLGLIAVLAAIGAKSRRKAPVLIVLVALGIIVWQFAPASYWARVESIADYDEDPNAQSRFHTWKAGVIMAIGRPLLGVGPGNYQNVYGREFVSSRPRNVSPAWLAAHSVYIQILAELGFTGLGIFLALVVANFRTCSRLLRQARSGKLAGPGADIVSTAAAACQTSLVGFLVSGAFLSVGYYPHFWYLTALVAIAENLGREASPASSSEAFPSAKRAVAPRRIVRTA